MTRTADPLETYLDDVERWTAGARARRRAVRAEAEEHLREAQAAGELDEALRRLGDPRDAARTFVAGRALSPASRLRRLGGAVVDFGSLIALFYAGGVAAEPFDTAGQVTTTWFRVHVSCAGGCGAGAIVMLLAIVGALFWFAVVLTLLEWRYGRTPGKLLAGTRVVSEDGTAISLGQAVIRRLPLVFSGVLQIVDWAFVLFDRRRQRAFDKLARTLVVAERQTY